MHRILTNLTILVFTIFSGSLTAQEYEYPSDEAAALIAKGKLKEAVTFCKTTIDEELNKISIDSIEIAYLNAYLSRAYSYQEGEINYLASIKACEHGIIYCPSTEEGILQKARLYNDKSISEFSTNLQFRSFQSNLKALELFSSVENPDYNYIINIYVDMSRASVYNGNAEEAKRLLRQSERLYAENKDSVDDQRKNTSIGRIASYEYLLPYNKIYQLTELGTSTKDSLEITKTLNKLEQLCKREDFSEWGEGIFYTASLNEVADWYVSRIPESRLSYEDLNIALELVNKAITLVEKRGFGGTHLLYVFKYNRSKILMLLNQLEKAEAVIENVIETTEFTSVNTPTFFAQKGRIHSRRLLKDSALVAFNKTLKTIHQGEEKLKEDLSNFSPSNIFKHNEVLYSIATDLTKYFPKDKNVKSLVANIYKIGLTQFEASYDKRKYNKRQDLYLRRIVKGLITTKGWGYNKDINYPDLLNHYENIRNELVWLEFYQKRKTDNLVDLEAHLVDKKVLITSIAEAQNNNDIKSQDSLQTALELAQYSINEKYPNADLLRENDFKIKELQEQITDNECVLKYILFESEIAVFKITKTNIDVELIDWKYQNQVNELRSVTLSNNQQNRIKLSETLGEFLIPDLDPKISDLTINPDGALAKFPFEMLIREGKYLLENYTVHYTSNLGFIFPKIEVNTKDNVLAIYRPNYSNKGEKLVTRSAPVFLEGAKSEATLISDYFSAELYDENLSKSIFKETAPNASLLHLAMHAEINPNNSGLNQLLFDNEKDSDKNLSLEEIYGMQLNANQVVLSACNTGFGNDNDGRGMESFQRAFTFAGVPATVASLWEVPDLATKEIMVNFYKNLKKGQTKSLALKNAKLTYRNKHRNTKLEEPYYWAGFVLYGEDKPITFSKTPTLWFILLPSLMLLFSVIYIKRKSLRQVA